MHMRTTRTLPLQQLQRRTTRRRALRSLPLRNNPLERRRRKQRRRRLSRHSRRDHSPPRRRRRGVRRGTLPRTLSRRNRLRRHPKRLERSEQRTLQQSLLWRLQRAHPPSLTPLALLLVRRLRLPSPVDDAPSLGSVLANSRRLSAVSALAGVLRGAVRTSPILQTRTRGKTSLHPTHSQLRLSSRARRELRGLRQS